MVSESLRENIRALYDFRCGYCGVTEAESAGQLEIDHFCPRSHAGKDALDNLVYACPTCNRFKGDYWPEPEASPDLKLLHPQQDDLSAHIGSLPDGRLIGLTKRGWFHIQRLRLNRTQLIDYGSSGLSNNACVKLWSTISERMSGYESTYAS